MSDRSEVMAQARRTTILAISRQLGSGGAFIGRTVADRLRLRYADRDILHRAAQNLGVDDAEVGPLEERVESFWEHLAPLFLLGVAGGPINPVVPPQVSSSALFDVESRIIHALAAREDLVIVGRGAPYVLKGHPGLVSVFVHAPEHFRVARAAQTFGISDPDESAALVRRSDAQRAKFNKALTERDWTDASQYDLCVDTSSIGLDRAADIVTDIVAARLRANEGDRA